MPTSSRTVAAIQRQFHHLVRTVPGNGRLIVNAEDARLAEVLAMGCWTPVDNVRHRHRRLACAPVRSRWFRLRGVASRTRAWRGALESARPAQRDERAGRARGGACGRHRGRRGVAGAGAVSAMSRARLELIGEHAGVRVYDDFAHHPTAIATTLAGLRAKVGDARILVGMEPRSNSMRMGAHADELAPSLRDADAVVFLQRAELAWDASRIITALNGRGRTAARVDELIASLLDGVRAGDHVVFIVQWRLRGAHRGNFSLHWKLPEHKLPAWLISSTFPCFRCPPCCSRRFAESAHLRDALHRPWCASCSRSNGGFGVCLILDGSEGRPNPPCRPRSARSPASPISTPCPMACSASAPEGYTRFPGGQHARARQRPHAWRSAFLGR